MSKGFCVWEIAGRQQRRNPETRNATRLCGKPAGYGVGDILCREHARYIERQTRPYGFASRSLVRP